LEEITKSEAVPVYIPMMIYTKSHIRTHMSEILAFQFVHLIALQRRIRDNAELALQAMWDRCGAGGGGKGGGWGGGLFAWTVLVLAAQEAKHSRMAAASDKSSGQPSAHVNVHKTRTSAND
jgi:hypothetical protein